MKILNLYAGIGGNRKLWGNDHDITAVELDPTIAKIYKEHFPNDTVLVVDAHQYLLEHFEEYEFIWSSPPCPTHSRAVFIGTYKKNGDFAYRPPYPDMTLYQEVLLLQHLFKKIYCVENVTPYYTPLIAPQVVDRHCFWANFHILDFMGAEAKHHATMKEKERITGFDLSGYKGIDKGIVKTLRNCVDSKLGKHVLDSAIKNKQEGLFK